ncbi:MAG: hypothetical protein PHG35_03540 [Dehalococcoidales bacterium]|nr:hypothetical protein [Dehalococcoidales bacterium]
MDTITMVHNRFSSLKPLYDRMDRAKALAYLDPYTLTKKQNGKDVRVDDAISVTMPQPAIFANAIVSDLMTALWQTQIEGNISEKQKHKIEQFIEDNLAQADEGLGRLGKPSLFAWLCNHVCIRSLIGVRWVTQVLADHYVTDLVCEDMRWTPFEYGRKDLDWIAPITYRRKDEIVAQYGLEDLKDGTDIEVVDYWDGEKNEVWVDSKLVTIAKEFMVLPQKHALGRPPFVINAPATGFMLRSNTGDEELEHMAEDIFFLNRGLYDELNRSVSIKQTLGMDVLIPPYEQETEGTDKTADDVPKSGEVAKVTKGERHIPVPRGDLNNASISADNDIQKAIQMGGVNDIDTGDVNQQVSAVWITEQSEIRNKVRKPRLDCIGQFYILLDRMIIEQYQIAAKTPGVKELEIGVLGRKRKYSADQLGDPSTYTISVQGMSRSKKQEIANMAIAQAAKAVGMPEEDIVKNILMVDDPDGYMRRAESERAKQAEPAIALMEQGLRLIEEADELQGEDNEAADAKRIEAMWLRDRIIAMKQQQDQPSTSTQGETKTTGASLIPLLGQKGLKGM